jgi:hypothetical protein
MFTLRSLRCVRKLIDDFPRTLSEFERSKIGMELEEALRFSTPTNASVLTQKCSLLPPHVNVCLDQLKNWTHRIAMDNLNALRGDLKDGELAAMQGDKRFLAFVSRLDTNLPSDILVQLLPFIPPDTPRAVSILEELIIVRELEGLSATQVAGIVESLVPGSSSTINYESVLFQWAENSLEPAVLLKLVAFAVKSGRPAFPDTLLPLVSKHDLIHHVLAPLLSCEFPATIARTVRSVGDLLTRLSFRKLVEEEDRITLLDILARLKVKLDTMVYVHDNPFYDQRSYRTDFLDKVLRTLSNDFHVSAISLPMTPLSDRMMALKCLNRLKPESVDVIVNRISAFGDTLLSPMAVEPTVLRNVFYAITHHPSFWKRRDRYRQAMGVQSAKLLRRHALEGRMSSSDLISCAKSLMRIHNREIRSVTGEVLSSLEPSHVSAKDLIAVVEIAGVLVKHKEPNLTLPTVVGFMRGLPLAELRPPQLITALEVCRSSRLVNSAADILDAIIDRISRNGGLLSPFNIVRIMTLIGELRLINSKAALECLSACLPEPSSLHPELASRLNAALTLTAAVNPHSDSESLDRPRFLSVRADHRSAVVIGPDKGLRNPLETNTLT